MREKVIINIFLFELFKNSDEKNVIIENIKINNENPIASSPILNPKI